MSTVIAAVRVGTRANAALCMLQALAGQATKAEWMIAMKWKYSVATFDQDVMFMLTHHRLVFRRGDIWAISDEGKRIIGIDPDTDSGAGMPASIREAPVQRPLSRQYRPRMDVTREGAFDYREIPSRHGDQRIPYETSLSIVGGVPKA